MMHQTFQESNSFVIIFLRMTIPFTFALFLCTFKHTGGLFSRTADKNYFIIYFNSYQQLFCDKTFLLCIKRIERDVIIADNFTF